MLRRAVVPFLVLGGCGINEPRFIPRLADAYAVSDPPPAFLLFLTCVLSPLLFVVGYGRARRLQSVS